MDRYFDETHHALRESARRGNVWVAGYWGPKGWVKGFGPIKGAIATSIGHDEPGSSTEKETESPSTVTIV